jgi:hypothetical protein
MVKSRMARTETAPDDLAAKMFLAIELLIRGMYRAGAAMPMISHGPSVISYAEVAVLE